MQTKFGRLFGCRLNLVHSRPTLVVRCLLTTQFPVQRTPTYHIQPPRNTISRLVMTNIARLAQRQSVRQQLRRAHGSNPGRSGRNQIPRFVLRHPPQMATNGVQKYPQWCKVPRMNVSLVIDCEKLNQSNNRAASQRRAARVKRKNLGTSAERSATPLTASCIAVSLSEGKGWSLRQL